SKCVLKLSDGAEPSAARCLSTTDKIRSRVDRYMRLIDRDSDLSHLARTWRRLLIVTQAVLAMEIVGDAFERLAELLQIRRDVSLSAGLARKFMQIVGCPRVRRGRHGSGFALGNA